MKYIHECQVRNDQQDLQLQQARHIENGTISCGEASVHDWKPSGLGDNFMYTVQTAQFDRKYVTAPVVHIAVLDAHINKDHHAYFDVDVLSVSTAGFSVKCSLGDAGHYIHSLTLSWVSLPQ